MGIPQDYARTRERAKSRAHYLEKGMVKDTGSKTDHRLPKLTKVTFPKEAARDTKDIVSPVGRRATRRQNAPLGELTMSKWKKKSHRAPRKLAAYG